MSKKGTRKDPRWTTPKAKRRYGLWGLGIAVAAAAVVVAIIALQGPGTTSTSPSTSTSIPSLVEIPRISPQEVKAQLDAGSNMVIVDARSKEEYEQIHIAGAISIPLKEIALRSSELRGYDEVITYCT